MRSQLSPRRVAVLDLRQRALHTHDVTGVTWQWLLVLAIELGAIVYLARKMFGPVTAPVRRRPDVPVSALVRKKR